MPRITLNPFNIALPRIVVGGSHLLAGNILGALIGLASFALTARVLTPAEFGLLILIVTGVTLVGKLLGFQSWQAVVRFGAAFVDGEDQPKLAAIIRCGVSLDAIAATLAGLVSLGLAYVGSIVFGWEPQILLMAVTYSLTLFFGITGTAIGILRMCDRFDLLALHAVLTALIKLSLIFPLFLLEVDILQFLIAWAAAQILSNVLLICFGVWQLRILNISTLILRGAEGTRNAFHEMKRFFFTTNIDGIVRVIRDLDVPVVGGVLGTEGVGIYKVGRQIAGLLMKVVDPFYAAVYPHLARAIPAGDYAGFRKTVNLSSVGVGCFCIAGFGIFVFIGYDLVRWFFSESYSSAYGVALWCLAGGVVWGFAHPFAPALLAMGFAGRLLIINAIFTAAYLALTVNFATTMGVSGAGIAYFIFFLCWGGTMFFLVRWKLKKRLVIGA